MRRVPGNAGFQPARASASRRLAASRKPAPDGPAGLQCARRGPPHALVGLKPRWHRGLTCPGLLEGPRSLSLQMSQVGEAVSRMRGTRLLPREMLAFLPVWRAGGCRTVRWLRTRLVGLRLRLASHDTLGLCSGSEALTQGHIEEGDTTSFPLRLCKSADFNPRVSFNCFQARANSLSGRGRPSPSSSPTDHGGTPPFVAGFTRLAYGSDVRGRTIEESTACEAHPPSIR